MKNLTNRSASIKTTLRGLLLIGLVIGICAGTASPVHAQCGGDPGNDGTNTATPLSGCGMTSAAIDCAGDNDWYGFQATEAGFYTWTLSPSNRGAMVAYAADGVTEIDAGWNTVSVSAQPGEVTYIVVSPIVSDDTFSYTMTMTGCPAGCGADPGNDTWFTATDLNGACGLTTAAFDCSGDLDYYRFVAPSSGDFTFETTSNLDTEIRLLEDDGEVIGYDDDGGFNQNAQLIKTLSQGTTYFVQLNEYGNDGTGPYDLTVAGCTPQSCGSDPGNDGTSTATSLSGCGMTSAAIDCAGDNDWYVFQATVAGFYTWTLSPQNRGAMVVYAADGVTEVDAGWNSVSASSQPNDLTYIVVSPISVGDTFSYTMTMTGCPASSCGADPGNDSYPNATVISGCGLTSAAIDCAGDDDWYTFHVPADGTYTWTLNPQNRGGMTLFADDGTTVVDSGTNTVSATSLQGATVYVEVSAASSGDTFSYGLNTSGCPATGCGADPGDDDLSHATPFTTCGAVAAAVDCVNDHDVYRFVAPSSGSYTFETTGTTDTEIQLLSAVGVQLDHDDDTGDGTNAKLLYNLVQGTIYHPVVSEYGNDATGAYALHISGCATGGCGSDPGNDTTATATPLAGCGVTSAAVDCADDVDVYAFTPPAAGIYTLSTAGSGGRTYLATIDGAGGIMSGAPDTTSVSLTGGQAVYFKVSAYTAGSTFSYSLSLTGCPTSGCGGDPGNDTFNTATQLLGCGTISAALDCAGDKDYYRFSAPVDATYTVRLAPTVSSGIELFGPGGGSLGSDTTKVTANLTTSGGPYTVLVDSVFGNVGSYSLAIEGCSAVGGCPGDFDGDTSATATTLQGCGVISAAFDCQDDIDYFSFTAPKDGDFTFETLGATDTKIWVEDGTSDVGYDDDSGTDRNAKLEVRLTNGETYFVRLESHRGVTGAYDLRVSGCMGQPGAYVYYVPATAKVAGLGGTDWRSDLAVLNLGPAQASFTIGAWLRGQANPNPLETGRKLETGEVLNVEDLLQKLFGMASGAAALEITSDMPLAVSSRTYNRTAQGTYGQFIPGVESTEVVQVGETVYLHGMVENAAFRTNLGLVNPTGQSIHVKVTYYRADGISLGATQTYTVPAQGSIQRTRVLSEMVTGKVDLAWASLTCPDGEFVAFLSVVDQLSGDPVYRPFRRAPTTSVDVFVPGIAKVAGTAGTNWVSDLILLNVGQTRASATLELWMRDQPNSTPDQRSINLDPGRAQALVDVLPTLFGTQRGAAALRITAGPGLLVDARTFNLVTGGTYGQYVPSVSADDAATVAAGICFLLVTQSKDFRTNLGLVNAAQGAVDVTVAMFTEDGGVVGSPWTVRLAERGVIQVDRVVERFVPFVIERGYLLVTLPQNAGGSAVHAYTTVIDQATGDPIYETPTKLSGWDGSGNQ